jgi:hypothetical protein
VVLIDNRSSKRRLGRRSVPVAIIDKASLI